MGLVDNKKEIIFQDIMIKDDDPSFWSDCNYQAEDLSAKMARKFKPIPPPLNLSAMGDSDASSSPLKDFAMLATSPRSPLVQKNLPFRKRAHSYSSTQTSSECDSPESPRVPASPIAMVPSPFSKSPLPSPSHLFGKRYLQEPINSLLPSPNTSASFFNNECDPIKSPCMNFYRPCSELLPIPMLEKTSLKSPLQTPTRSVFLQNHVDSTLFFTDMDKLPLKSPLNTPIPRTLAQTVSDDVFVMPEPISIKAEPVEPEKENLATDNTAVIKSEPRSEYNGSYELEPPLDLAFDPEVKQERASPDLQQQRSREYSSMNYYADHKRLESYTAYRRPKNEHYISHGVGMYCPDISQSAPHEAEQPSNIANKFNIYKPITYRKHQNGTKRVSCDKPNDDVPKKSKKEVDDERPRRPMNAFMLFAKHQRPLLIQQHPGKDNRAISVVLGTAWRELDAAERSEYVRRAAAMASEHKRLHPDCWKRRRVRTNNNATSSGSPAPATNVATTS